MFEVIVSNRARKASKKLPDHDKRRIAELLFVLQQNPIPADTYDLKKMGGEVDTYRVRIGDTRVIYEILWNHHVVNVLVIRLRKQAYSK